MDTINAKYEARAVERQRIEQEKHREKQKEQEKSYQKIKEQTKNRGFER
jgi:hypothetical protein